MSEKLVSRPTTGLKAEAASKLEKFLATGIGGLYMAAWDRLSALGYDVDLRQVPTEENARALLWIAKNR